MKLFTKIDPQKIPLPIMLFGMFCTVILLVMTVFALLTQYSQNIFTGYELARLGFSAIFFCACFFVIFKEAMKKTNSKK